MTSEERSQLVEDIKKSNRLRADIVERAETDKDFDILDAWETVEELDESINQRVSEDRLKT